MTQKNDSLVPPRPLSPFMLGTTYRLQLTSVLSLTHRLTGMALVAGTVLLVAWLWAAAYSPLCFTHMSEFFSGIFGQILLFGWSFAFYFHLSNGIRHLFWDIGKGFEIHDAYRSGYAVVIATIVLTGITWIAVISQGSSQ